jgi:aminopeptidase C
MTVPDAKAPAAPGTDQARWTGLSESQRRNEMAGKPGPELTITQELRQEGYDKWETTDDHGMVVFGIAKDQTGKEYFMVKNSWGASGDYKGTYYASKAFVAYKTTNILVHKDGIPKNIRKKLGIK